MSKSGSYCMISIIKSHLCVRVCLCVCVRVSVCVCVRAYVRAKCLLLTQLATEQN